MTTTGSPNLPGALTDALAVVGADLAQGRPVDDAMLNATLSLMDELPAGNIGTVDGSIAIAADLNHRQLVWSFRRRLSDKEQLLRTRNLEYLLFFHRDGRVREVALLKASGGLRSPFFFAAVAWRLNDWVSQVRDAAARCVQRNFPLTEPRVVAAAAIALLPRQGSWRRWQKERDIFDALLARADVAEQLAELMISKPTGAVASTLRIALRATALDPYLERIAREAIQPAVRAFALTTLIDRQASWPIGRDWQWIDKSMGVRRRVTVFASRVVESSTTRDDLIAAGLTDRSPAVRNAALTGIIRYMLGTPEARNHASLLTTDRSRTVRERAAFIVRADVG